MIEPAKIAAILLAAGRSERFGDADKLLVPLDGVPLALHAARRMTEIGVGWRFAVCRAGSPLIEGLSDLGFETKINPDPARGLSSSLALGIEQARLANAEAALVVLGDMPFVSSAHLSALIARFDTENSPLVASSRDGIRMPPALFGKRFFARLEAAKGDEGGRSLFSDATLVSADPTELRDIDHPEDIG